MDVQLLPALLPPLVCVAGIYLVKYVGEVIDIHQVGFDVSGGLR